jgi:hypothetical protein
MAPMTSVASGLTAAEVTTMSDFHVIGDDVVHSGTTFTSWVNRKTSVNMTKVGAGTITVTENHTDGHKAVVLPGTHNAGFTIPRKDFKSFYIVWKKYKRNGDITQIWRNPISDGNLSPAAGWTINWGTPYFYFHLNGGANQYKDYNFTAAESAVTSSSGLLCIEAANTFGILRLNDTLRTVITTSTFGGTSTATNTGILSETNGNQGSKCEVLEMIGFSTAAATTEQDTQIRAYLEAKYPSI